MKYKRVLLKLSGEALMGNLNFGLDVHYLKYIVGEIDAVVHKHVQLGIVIGGGNIFRGKQSKALEIDKAQADYMGMLATIINGLALQDALEKCSIQTRLMSSIEMNKVCEPYIRRRAIRHLEKGRVVILSGGMGNPFVTTDSAGSWRASEIKADILLKGTRVNGIYSADPEKDQAATKFDKLSFRDVHDKDLDVMDSTAFSFAKENKVKIIVFNINQKGNLLKIIQGENIGTLVSG